MVSPVTKVPEVGRYWIVVELTEMMTPVALEVLPLMVNPTANP
jgi:hypothetical protein